MRILLLSCGDSIHTIRWANEYIVRGYDVLLVSNKDHIIRDDIDKKVAVKYLKYSGTKAYYLNAIQLRKIYKEFNPDIVNVHYASGYGTLARIARIKPCVLSVWGSDVYVFPKKNIINKIILTKNVKYATAIASTSESMLVELKKIVNLNNKKTIVTPFGIDTDFFSPIGDKYSIKENKFIFGVVKKLTFLYGIDYLIKAFKIVHDTWLKYKNGLEPYLFICGNGENLADFQKLANDLNISSSVCIQGYIEHSRIPSVIRSIDVFCLSSLSESFGVSALEAMACEKPVIATDADGFLEIIKNDNFGIIVPRKDHVAMAEKMLAIYNNKIDGKQMGINARKYVVENYQWHKNALVMFDLFETIINKN